MEMETKMTHIPPHPTLGPSIANLDDRDIEIIDFETRRLESDGIMHPELGRAFRAMIRDAVRNGDRGIFAHIVESMESLENNCG
jgi:hypothetical protein